MRIRKANRRGGTVRMTEKATHRTYPWPKFRPLARRRQKYYDVVIETYNGDADDR